VIVWLAIKRLGGAALGAVPWQAWAVIAAIAAGAFLIWRIERTAYERGAIEERVRINAANDKARDKADAGERDVLRCPPGKWDRGAGRCVSDR